MIGLGAIAGAVWLFCLGVGLWMYFRKKAPKTTILFFLIGGAGLGGILGVLLVNVLQTILNLLAGLGARFLGVTPDAVKALVVVLLVLEIFAIGLWFKKAKPQRMHPWMALILPTVVVASNIPVIRTVLDGLTGVADSVASQIS